MKFFTAALFIATSCACIMTWADSPEMNPRLKSTEAYSLITRHPAQTLFIDVRTPQEITATGMPANLDVSIPLGNETFADDSSRRLAHQIFVATVSRALTKKSLPGTDAAIVIICRTARNAEIAAKILDDAGFTRVYFVFDGTHGVLDKRGYTVLNGWKADGLPWIPPLNSGSAARSVSDSK